MSPVRELAAYFRGGVGGFFFKGAKGVFFWYFLFLFLCVLFLLFCCCCLFFSEKKITVLHMYVWECESCWPTWGRYIRSRKGNLVSS